ADGPAIRFQLQNANVNFTEWILKSSFQKQQFLNLGPARVVLAEPGYVSAGGNEIVLRKKPGSEFLDYEIYTASKGGKTAEGKIKEGESLETGWMGLKFLLLRYLPQAREKV